MSSEWPIAPGQPGQQSLTTALEARVAVQENRMEKTCLALDHTMPVICLCSSERVNRCAICSCAFCVLRKREIGKERIQVSGEQSRGTTAPQCDNAYATEAMEIVVFRMLDE